jgi:DNA-directed RNA polymerase I, II, and III subunit RPABC2
MPIIKRNPNKPNKSKSKSYFGGGSDSDDSGSDMDGGAGSDAGSNAGSNNAGSDYDENDGNDSEVDFMNVEQEAAAKKNKKVGRVDEDLGDDVGDNAGGEDIEDDDADADPDEEEEEEDEDEEDEDEQYIESDEEGAANNPKQTKMQGKRVKQVDVYSNEDEIEGDGEDDGDGGDDDDEPDENYLQKFSADINKNYITDFHPECIISNYDEVATLAVVVRDKSGIIIDDLHRTVPYLSKYERARILGQRAKQINAGAPAFVKVPEKVIDGYLIAEMELANKTIPFIIRRPLPNGGSEYWRVNDLENIGF